jgi:hypothetical protein
MSAQVMPPKNKQPLNPSGNRGCHWISIMAFPVIGLLVPGYFCFYVVPMITDCIYVEMSSRILPDHCFMSSKNPILDHFSHFIPIFIELFSFIVNGRSPSQTTHANGAGQVKNQ